MPATAAPGLRPASPGPGSPIVATASPSRREPAPLVAAVLLALLALHAVVIPVLYVGLDGIVVRTHSELFVSVTEGYTAARVREFENHAAPLGDPGLTALADEIQSSGLVEYTEIRWNGHLLQRSTDPNRPIPPPTLHDRFGEGADQIYHVSAPLAAEGVAGTLRLGFHEAEITAHIAEARRLIVLALAGYVAAAIAAALFLASWIAKPIRQLERRSMLIAAGDLNHGLRVESAIREFRLLSESLEHMRVELIDTAAQLHAKQRLETVGTLAGGVAHEFNNLLVPLTLFTEAALKSLPPEHAARPLLERSLGAARRAREVTGKLLQFSGKGQEPAMARLKIAPAVEEALRLFESLRPSNIAVDSRIDAAADPVLCNPGLVVQIVINLCTNAYKAIPPSGGRIGVYLENTSTDGRRFVELRVEDTGSGMDAATVQRIFEPFFTTGQVGQGTGLGLAVVHGLVRSVGATISVDSAPGRGTTCRILFPSAAAEA